MPSRANCLGSPARAAPDCWAVGSKSSKGDGTLLEHWNGSDWRMVKGPRSLSASELSAVTCVSESQCWAVGQRQQVVPYRPTSQMVIARWNGHVWAKTKTPTLQSSVLHSVACTETANCWAVGSHGAVTGLAMRWNGVTWRTVPSAGKYQNFLGAVCTAATNCWAVGLAGLERWNGARWAVISSPQLAAQSGLVSVACGKATSCWAVGVAGETHDITLAEHWNGSSWRLAKVPSPAGRSGFLAVTCVSASNCWAVGYSGGGTLVEHWNGTAWSTVHS